MCKAYYHHVSAPMKNPFFHSEKRHFFSDTIILEIHYKGLIGIGECVPRLYVTGETVDSVKKSLHKIDISMLADQIIQKSNSLRDSINRIDELLKSLKPNLRCTLEIAFLDILGKIHNLSITDIVKSFLTSPMIANQNKKDFFQTTQVMDFSIPKDVFINERGPFHCVKVKVGNQFEENLSRIAYIRKCLGNEVPIILDANMAWTLNQAIDMAKKLRHLNITYYEEPLQQRCWGDYRSFREATCQKVMLDESLCNYSDALISHDQKSCDMFNIRISKCGGIMNSIRLIEFAYKNEIEYQLGAQVAEMGPLIAAGRHLMDSISGFFAFEGGQPDRFFGGDYIVDPMPLVDRITNTAKGLTGYGLGVNLTNNIKKLSKESCFLRGG